MKKARRFCVVSDNHGDMADPESVSALWEFMREWRPEIRIHAGDAFDLRNLRKGASDEEKAASLAEDWEAGTDFLRRFFEGGEENHFLRGNHDERIYDFTKSATGVLRDYANDGVKRLESVVKRSRAQMLPYDSELGVLPLGRLNILHGYHVGVNACRLHAAIYGNCLFGHVHTDEIGTVPALKPTQGRSNACMCIRDMDYANKKTGKLRWANGWHYGLVFPDGSYQLLQTRKIGGRFYAAQEIKEY